MGKLAPSILSADFANLGRDTEAVTAYGADFLHIDVMDGHFVPNISFGAGVMKSLNSFDTAPYDVHLMIENPDDYLEDFVTEKTEYIVVHQEACTHLDRTIEHIKSLGVKAGVALNPATSLSTLEYVIDKLDLVLVMSVNPGFGGQKFIPAALDKVKKLSEIREITRASFVIEVDGGVNLDNAKELSEAGCDLFVAGSAVFKADDVEKRVKEFKELIG